MKKFFSITIILIVALGITTGFIIDDPYGSKPQSSSTSKTTTNQVSPVYTSYGTPVFTDNFDTANDTISLKARGYLVYNRSTTIGLTTWFTPTAVFPSFNGPATGYVGANYNATTGAGNIDLWLVLPRVAGGTLAGDSLYFYSRSVYNNPYVDSIRVMYSVSDSVYNGTWTELGRFKVNSDSSGTFNPWVRKGFRAPTASANGRFAIRYCVANGGPSGSNSNYIGIDALTIERSGTPPTPPTWSFADSSATGVSVNCISTVNKDVAWIGCNGGLIKKTTNGGATFTAINNATIGANDIYAICGLSANVAFVSTSPSASNLYRTSDGGTTFTLVLTQAGGFFDDIRFKDANTGFLYGDPVGSRWTLFKTTNAGVNWDSTGLYLPQVGSEAGWNNAMWLDGNNIWFGTNNTKVYKSNNFGATGSWTSGATTGSTNSYSVAFNGNIGFSGTSAAVKSTDGGATYAAFTLAGSGNIYAFNTIKNSNRFWVARFNTIYGSTDNGATFTAQYVRSSTIQAMSLVLDGNTVRGFAGTSAGAIYKFDEGGVTSVTPVSTEIPQNFSLSQNYPNPFNPTTKINFALPKSGLVSLKVYDMLGKEVATLVNEVREAGTYAVDFNGASLSSGMYFYKISVNGFSEVKRMMLIK